MKLQILALLSLIYSFSIPLSCNSNATYRPEHTKESKEQRLIERFIYNELSGFEYDDNDFNVFLMQTSFCGACKGSDYKTLASKLRSAKNRSVVIYSKPTKGISDLVAEFADSVYFYKDDEYKLERYGLVSQNNYHFIFEDGKLMTQQLLEE